MSFFAFGNNFNKDGIFAFVDNAQDIAPDIIIKHDCRLHFFMGFHKSFGTLAALFFIAGEDNAELQRQSVFQTWNIELNATAAKTSYPAFRGHTFCRREFPA